MDIEMIERDETPLSGKDRRLVEHLSDEAFNQRFWKFVDRKSDDECWRWTGGVASESKPYGQFGLRGGGSAAAHRVSFALHHGFVPGRHIICHHCDNPRCVNPRHLFLGDAAANNRDMMAKGRSRTFSGERHGRAKLTAADVEAIRAARGLVTQSVLAKKYGVVACHISRIQLGQQWSDKPPSQGANG